MKEILLHNACIGRHIEITGSGNASYDLQYGSDGDITRGDGVQSTETFPFTFHVHLNHQFEIEDVD